MPVAAGARSEPSADEGGVVKSGLAFLRRLKNDKAPPSGAADQD
jgi:hypothetical protein